MAKRAHVFISGKVQGVYYRSYAEDAARRLGIRGWIRNLRDGRVEAVFEGEDEAVEEMIRWCWQGSPMSRVDEVEVEWEPYRGEFQDFSIRYRY
jgi:acylphosphatase